MLLDEAAHSDEIKCLSFFGKSLVLLESNLIDVPIAIHPRSQHALAADVDV